MPAPSATTAPPRHQWHMAFDRVACRVCGVEHTAEDDDAVCKRAAKIRPIAKFRQQHDYGCNPISGCKSCRTRGFGRSGQQEGRA